MAAWTLTYSGTTQSLAAWGISACERERTNVGLDHVTLRVPGPSDGTVLFAYGAAVVILRDGAVWFRGKVGTPQRAARGTSEAISYRINGPWWDLERLVFQQSWQTYNGDPDDLVEHYASELYLGQSPAGEAYDTGEQIVEVLDWAIARGVSLQKGTIDPEVNIPAQQVKDISCAEAIKMMLRWSPDCVGWFDYATSPPTWHCRKLANLTAVTVTVPTSQVSGIDLVPKHDLVLPSVMLRFKRINTVDGKAWTEITDQLYPASGVTGLELGAAVATVELSGVEGTNVSAEILVGACDAQHATKATRLAWWARKDPILNNANIPAASLDVTSATIKDGAGNTVSLATYPYELLDGSLAPWMNDGTDPVIGVQVTITANCTYDLYAESGHVNLLQSKRVKALSARVTLTNGVSGTYQALDSLTPAEPIPTGLAQAIYDACSTLQYEGTIDLVADEVPASLGLGNKVALAMPSATYSNLLVQRTREDVASGRISLSLGPPQHLGVDDLIGLLRVNRSRVRILNPRARATGLSADQSAVTLGNQSPRENTTGGAGSAESVAVIAAEDTGNKSMIRSDAAAGRIIMQVVDESTGAVVSGKAKLVIDLPTDGYAKEFKLREWQVCVGDPPVVKYALFLSTEAYNDALT